jgi:hypothetical protein
MIVTVSPLRRGCCVTATFTQRYWGHGTFRHLCRTTFSIIIPDLVRCYEQRSEWRCRFACIVSARVLYRSICGAERGSAGQDSEPAELDRAGAALDTALFDSYNKCDLEKFASFFMNDVEFYHDQGGVTQGQTALTDSVKKNICGKTTRELVPGSLKVFYMNGYGMLETGVHRFHHPGHEDTEGVGEGQFIHLWQYKDGTWKITRAISYDHHSAGK